MNLKFENDQRNGVDIGTGAMEEPLPHMLPRKVRLSYARLSNPANSNFGFFAARAESDRDRGDCATGDKSLKRGLSSTGTPRLRP